MKSLRITVTIVLLSTPGWLAAEEFPVHCEHFVAGMPKMTTTDGAFGHPGSVRLPEQ